MRRALFLLVSFLTLAVHAWSQGFNCTSFASTGGTTGACGTDVPSVVNTGQPFGVFGTFNGANPSVGGGQILFVPAGSDHIGNNLNFQTAVNVQAFTTIFTFIPNGWNLAFIAQNNTNTTQGGPPQSFAGGAGCEAGIYQAFGVPWISGIPTDIFALEYDSNSGITSSDQSFVYSTAQMYGESMSPCIPNDSQTFFYITSKISTSPLPSNLPVQFTASSSGTVLTVTAISTGTIVPGMGITGNSVPGGVLIASQTSGTTGGIGVYALNTSLTSSSQTFLGENNCMQTTAGTCDTYTANVSYNGANLSLCMFDVTAANGSCSSGTSGTGTFFQHTWNGVNIPSMVGSVTAFVGLAAGAGAGGPTGYPLILDSWSYTVNSPTTPNFGTGPYTGQTLVTANPTASPVAGTYSGAQSVTLSSATPNNAICYLLSTTVPALPPQTDNHGGCIVGTLFSTPVTVSSTSHLYAIASNPGNISNTTGGQFSSVVDNAFVITGTTSASANGVSAVGVKIQ
jgi:hypothetical protein